MGDELSAVDSFDPLTLFNSATVHLHLPRQRRRARAPAPPPPTTLDDEDHVEDETDKWVTQLIQDKERELAYYDQHLPVYLFLRLQPRTLTRQQATSFLLPSLSALAAGAGPPNANGSAHLTLTLDVSYIEGNPHANARQHKPTPPTPNPNRRGSLSLGLGQPSAPPLVQPPSTSAKRHDTVHLQGVGGMTAEPGGLWVASHAFDFSATAGCDHDGENEDGGERMLKQDDRREMGTLERKARRKNDRMWVGRDLTSAVEGDGAQGHAWVGVWEFVAQAVLPLPPMSLIQPRLCLTVTLTYRDDPRLLDLLARTTAEALSAEASQRPEGVIERAGDVVSGGHASKPSLSEMLARERVRQEEEGESDDEYMAESFDDVNLLAGLTSTSTTNAPLHLPASRLPSLNPSNVSVNALGTASNSTAPHIHRRSSLTALSRSLVNGSAADVLFASSSTAASLSAAPILRRAVRRVVDVQRAVEVRMKVGKIVASTVAANELQSSQSLPMDSVDDEKEEGLVLSVEVERRGRGAFEIHDVDVKIGPMGSSSAAEPGGSGNRSGSDEVEIRRIHHGLRSAEQDRHLIQLGEGEQHNFLFALAPSAAASSSTSLEADFDPAQSSFPSSAAVTAASVGIGAGGRSVTGATVPLSVADSPTQRYIARFGEASGTDAGSYDDGSAEVQGYHVGGDLDGEDVNGLDGGEDDDGHGGQQEDSERDRQADRHEQMMAMQLNEQRARWEAEKWLRRVTITVQGRAVVVAASAAAAAVSNASDDDFKDDAAIEDDHEDVFDSMWYCTLDIAGLLGRKSNAARPTIAITTNGSSTIVAQRHALPLSTITPAATDVSVSKRRSGPQPARNIAPVTAIAGSKRHTLASLAALSLASQKTSSSASSGSARLPSDILRPLPLAPNSIVNGNGTATTAHAPTPGATGSQPRRFFSLPAGMTTPELHGRASFDHRPGTPSLGGGGRPDFNRRITTTGLGLQHTQTHHHSSQHPQAQQPPPSAPAPERQEHGDIVVSVSLLPLRQVKQKTAVKQEDDDNDDQQTLQGPEAPADNSLSPSNRFQFPSPSASPSPGASSDLNMPLPPSDATLNDRAHAHSARSVRIGLLHVFLVEVFILNRSDLVKRFTVGVPKSSSNEDVAGLSHKTLRGDRVPVATIVALENDVRIGPLAPNTCASVRMRFLAVRPGVHTLDELRLVDLATGRETKLKKPLAIVVEA